LAYQSYKRGGVELKVNYKNINTNKLHDELIAAGVPPVYVTSSGQETWVEFSDSVDMSIVNTVLLSHDPTPLPIKPTTDEVMSDLISVLVDSGVITNV
jgi:hypothetical protein